VRCEERNGHYGLNGTSITATVLSTRDPGDQKALGRRRPAQADKETQRKIKAGKRTKD
jgi:hypothetical protein